VTPERRIRSDRRRDQKLFLERCERGLQPSLTRTHYSAGRVSALLMCICRSCWKTTPCVSQATDWARGFIRCTEMRRTGWAQLMNDEEYGGCMIPVMMLYHEHDDDPELRPPPIGPEQREEMILQMATAVVRAYRYFQRRAAIPSPRSRPGKAGRNEPCPCGSGKKYKRCCGGATIH
jgi:hypothetical protein